MVKKLLLFFSSIANTALLVLMVSLGSQNLSSKHSINLGFSSTEKYPSGFLIGMSISLGYLSGGLTTSFLSNTKNKTFS